MSDRDRLADALREADRLRAEINRLKTIPMKYRRMEFNAQLQQECNLLTAELAAAKADAERYRWLREWLTDQQLLFVQWCTPEVGTKCGDYWLLRKPAWIWGTDPAGYGKTEEEAIDAARAVKGKPHG